MRKTSDNSVIIPGRGAETKAKIVAAGISLGRLARASGIAPSTLSDYLAGRLANIDRQLTIFQAFARLSGRAVTWDACRQFWGGDSRRGVA